MEYEPSATEATELVPDQSARLADRRLHLHGSFHYSNISIAVCAHSHRHTSAGAIHHSSARISWSRQALAGN